MSDTKLDPASLTAEERAIVEETVTYRSADALEAMKVEYWSRYYDEGLLRIEVRRALFIPESEEPAQAECPECGGLNGEHHNRMDFTTCFRPDPEPAPVAADDEPKHCSFCAEPAGVERGGKSFCLDHLPDDLRRKPAPVAAGEISELDDRHMRLASPEAQAKFREAHGLSRPVQPGDCENCESLIAERDELRDQLDRIPDSQPVAAVGNEDCLKAKSEGAWLGEVLAPVAAGEMPEAVRNVISALVQAAADSDEPADQDEYKRVANALESWWRSQAREIQRLEFYVEDDGDSDPFAVPHNDPDGDYVLYSDHQKEIEALRAEVNDWRESARKAAEESCGDEVHCTCVGPLRARVAELETQVSLWVQNALRGG